MDHPAAGAGRAEEAGGRPGAPGLSVRTLRRGVIAVCVAGIAGMIVSSVRASTAGALTFGLVTAVAVLCLIAATAVAGGGAVPPAGPQPVEAPGDDGDRR